METGEQETGRAQRFSRRRMKGGMISSDCFGGDPNLQDSKMTIISVGKSC